MRGRSPAPFALDESSPEPPAARCRANTPLRLDRARSIHTLAAEQGHQEPPGRVNQREENKGCQELDRLTGASAMAGTINGSSPTVPGRQGRRRARQPVPRTRTAEFTLNAQEYALLVEAARQPGMARRYGAAHAGPAHC